MPSDRLFGPASTTEAMAAAVSDRAWVQRMLDFEAGLARAEATLGLVPQEAARAISAACAVERFDVERLGREGARAGTPVIPLVAALRASLPEAAARHVHAGATTQDVLDTAMMLIARDGLALLAGDLEGLLDACAGQASRHRDTVMPARTLLQQALPTTFGLKAAGWLAAGLEARSAFERYRSRRLALQLGGAAGTLAAFGGRGLEVARALSRELGLAEPLLPWHTARGRVAELGSLLALLAGTGGKIALDVALLMQTEVGEAAEPAVSGRGGSSAMPHKRNPTGATAVRACVAAVDAQAALLTATMAQEHERAAGALQAEWPAVAEALRSSAGALAGAREIVEGLTVDAERMRRNLELTGGLLLSEHVVTEAAQAIGGPAARAAVTAAVEEAARSGRPFRDTLLERPEIAGHLGPEQVEAALDPGSYLGSAGALVDRALAAYHEERSRSS